MKGMYAYLDTIRCGQEIATYPVYFIATILPLLVEYHETLPVTAVIVCFLNT